MKSPWHRRKAVSYSSSVSFVMPSFSAARGVELPEEKTIKDRGLAIEPIVGLRSYYVDTDTPSAPLLLSYNGAPWPHRAPMHAFCGSNIFNDHEVPSEDCSCGIYAWLKELKENVTGNLFGEVYLWGDVLIGESGYRAESAYPKNLTIAASATRAIKRIRDGLEEAYGVPVELREPLAEEPSPPIATAGYLNPAQYWQLSQIGPYGTTGATAPVQYTHPGYSTPGYVMPPPKPHLGT